MKTCGLAKTANYEKESDNNRIISEALDRLIRALGILNGSVKVYVHQGKWGQRLEIQQNVSRELESNNEGR
jgi:hypothetical protein